MDSRRKKSSIEEFSPLLSLSDAISFFVRNLLPYFFWYFLVPSVEVVQSHFVVEESVGEVRIPLRRTGDTSQRLYVSCVTTFLGEEGRREARIWLSLTGQGAHTASCHLDFYLMK